MANHSRQIEDVRGSGVYPGTGPFPPSDAIVRSPAQLGHPENRPVHHVSLQSLETPALLAGRAVFGGYFLYNGINHFANHGMMTEYARAKKVPAPGAAVAASGLLIIAGGLSLLAGAWPKLGAGLISTFLLGVTPQIHAFWREQDPQHRMNEMVHFMKNAALLGATLLVAAQPEPWPLSATPRGGQLKPGHI